MSRNKSIMSFIDLTGQRFGRAIALERDCSVKSRVFWRCVCDCGNFFSSPSQNLRNGQCKSCGCLQKEVFRKNVTTHGMTKTKAFRAWMGIQDRCYNEKNPKFKNYGGRGIKICDRWLESFENFFADMGHPQPHESIDRINVDGDYCPENCRWADDKTQSRNKRNTRYITLDGETKPLVEWAESKNVDPETIWMRIDRGWSDRDALTKPINSNGKLRYLEFNGESKTISAWSKITNIPRGTIHHRIERGWTVEKALTTPPDQKHVKHF